MFVDTIGGLTTMPQKKSNDDRVEEILDPKRVLALLKNFKQRNRGEPITLMQVFCNLLGYGLYHRVLGNATITGTRQEVWRLIRRMLTTPRYYHERIPRALASAQRDNPKAYREWTRHG